MGDKLTHKDKIMLKGQNMHFFRSDLKSKKAPWVNVPHKSTMMCLNESTLNPLDIINESFQEKLQNLQLNRYFSEITNQLADKLEEYVGNGISKEQIIFGNGADDMIYNLLLSVREDKDSYALSLSPSYFDYKTYSDSVGLKVEFEYLNSDFSFSVENYIEKAKNENCKLAILCNPNNPTGHLLDDQIIDQVLSEVTEIPVLLDETYFEFSGKTFVDKLEKYPNLIIVRSFSKAFSSAGLRFGYMIASKQNRSEIIKCFQFFNTSLLVQAFALSILEEKQAFLNHNRNVIEMKNELFTEMKKFPNMEVINTHTNFLLFSIGDESIKLFDFISNKDLAVRNVSKDPMFSNKLRVTIGTKDQNELFLKILNEYFI